MSVVAFTFGSLGDIVSLLQIANHVRKALYDTTGASTKCRDLLGELDSVVHVVANMQRALSIEGPSRIPQSIENGLYHAVGVCLNLLAQINERILTWRKSLRDSQSARAVAADIWRRVGWMLFKKEELATLRRSLSGQVAAMNTLLTLAQGNQLDRFQEESWEIHHIAPTRVRLQYAPSPPGPAACTMLYARPLPHARRRMRLRVLPQYIRMHAHPRVRLQHACSSALPSPARPFSHARPPVAFLSVRP